MPMASHPATLRSVDLRFLPARAAYLVPTGDRDAFLRCVQEASSRWGGATELIVPMTGPAIDPFDRAVIELSAVDGLVDMGLPAGWAEAAAVATGLPAAPHIRIDDVLPLRLAPHPLHVRQSSQSEVGPAVAAEAGSPLWMTTAAGTFTSEGWQDIRAAGNPMQAAARTPWGPDHLGVAQLTRTTWLDRTVHNFAETYGSQTGGNLPLVLWVTADDGLEDCLDFWNLRALRPLAFGSMPMALVPVDAFEHWTTLAQHILSTLRRRGAPTPDVFITSSSVSTEQLAAIAHDLGLQRQDEGDESLRIGSDFFADATLRDPPYRYRVFTHAPQIALTKRLYGAYTQTDAHVSDGIARIRVDSPVEIDGGELLVRMNSNLFDGLPRRQEIAELIYPDASWREDGIQIGRSARPQHVVELTIPTLPTCLDAILRSRIPRYRPSTPGLIADAFAADTAVAALLEPGVVATIRQLTTPRRRRLAAELAKLRVDAPDADHLAALVAEWADTRVRSYKAADQLRNEPGWDRRAALERLAELGWAERGGEVACGTCNVRTFLPLDTIPSRGAVTCPACRNLARLTARPTADPTMFYRLDGMVDSVSDRGILPHLVAIATLTRDHDHVYLRPGTDIEGGQPHEVDLLGLIDKELVYGEVKSEGFRLTQEEIERDIAICTEASVDVYILAALDSVPESLVSHAQQRCDEGRLKLVVLQNLDPAHPATNL